MTGRLDHAFAAKDWIENSVNAQASASPNNEQLAAAYAAIAQTHATLALVEQQRIANVIALMQMQVECDENTELLAGEAMHGLIDYDRTPATPFSGPDEVAVMRPHVREALGL